MRPLRKLFQYVWPQWPRLVAAITTALLVGLLQSLTLATLSPLITVVMEKGGLHGWVEEKICRYQYGIHIHHADLTGPVHIGNVDPNSLGAIAGLQASDIIMTAEVSEAFAAEDPNLDTVGHLALSHAPKINLLVRRIASDASFEDVNLVLLTPYTDVNELDPATRARWSVASQTNIKQRQIQWGLRTIHDLIKDLPRGKTAEATTTALLIIISISVTTTCLRCVAKFCQIYMSQKIMMVADCRLREDLFAHVLGMPVGNFAQDSPSDIVSRITRDTAEMTNMLRVVFGKALREPCIALFCIVSAMYIQAQITLVFLIGGPVIVGVVAILGKKMRRASRKSLEASASMLGKLEETIAGLKIVKVFDRNDYERNSFARINQRLLKQHLRISRVSAGTPTLLEVLAVSAGSVGILIAVRSVNKGLIDSADFLVLLAFLAMAAESLRRSSDIWNYFQRANAAAGRIFEIMDHPLEDKRYEDVALPPISKEIQFDNIGFKYPSRPEPTLEGIHLTINAGENIAFVGPNGSGKTTLANLVPRFYDPTQGRVLIDGKDIRQVSLRSLRQQIGLVTQQSITFNETIAQNIAYGKLDATEAEIISAAQQAHAHEFIQELPLGYDTMIGEHGTGLSGGQLQRIVIARAIIKNPAILIFDEATSQVDAESEAKIHDAIETIMKNRTTIMIAHRFSTIISADKIVVIDDGRIAAQGQHEQLIETNKLYRALYETQLM